MASVDIRGALEVSTCFWAQLRDKEGKIETKHLNWIEQAHSKRYKTLFKCVFQAAQTQHFKL